MIAVSGLGHAACDITSIAQAESRGRPGEGAILMLRPGGGKPTGQAAASHGFAQSGAVLDALRPAKPVLTRLRNSRTFPRLEQASSPVNPLLG